MSDKMTWSDKQSLKEKLKIESDKVRAMDKAQRISYFKTYYMIPCIATLFVLICLFSYLFEVVQNQRHRPLLGGVFVNTSITPEGEALLKKDFPATLPEELNPKGKRSIALAEEYLYDMDPEYVIEINQKLMALTAQVAAGEIDFLIVDHAALEGLESSEIYTDGVEVLNLKEEGRAQRFGIMPEESYLVFTYHDWEEKKVELAEKLLEYMK